jgi:hypothetical protein
VQQTFSSERTPTVWQIIPSFEFLIRRWDMMANHVQHQALNEALNEGVGSLQKWYDQVDGSSSPAYFICLGTSLLFHFTMWSCTDLSTLVLDPTVKDRYFRRCTCSKVRA